MFYLAPTPMRVGACRSPAGERLVLRDALRECVFVCGFSYFIFLVNEFSGLPWIPLLDSLTGLAHVSMAALPPLAMWTARDPEAGVLGRELS